MGWCRIITTDRCVYKDKYNNCKHINMKRDGVFSKILGDRKHCMGEKSDRDKGVVPKCDFYKFKPRPKFTHPSTRKD